MAPRTLTQMHRHLTAYEVAVTTNSETRLLGFSERTTKGALLSIARANSDLILRLLGRWDGQASYTKATGWTFGPARIHFTGKTEREVASQAT